MHTDRKLLVISVALNLLYEIEIKKKCVYLYRIEKMFFLMKSNTLSSPGSSQKIMVNNISYRSSFSGKRKLRSIYSIVILGRSLFSHYQKICLYFFIFENIDFLYLYYK
jgi:hypothetical protein